MPLRKAAGIGVVYPAREEAEVSFQNTLQVPVCPIDNCEELYRVSGFKLEQKGFGPDIRKRFMNRKTVKPTIKGNCGDK